jgi:hypothetical protein
MKLAVTGTRDGMTHAQCNTVTQLLDLIKGQQLHHGDCVGVNQEVAVLAQTHGYELVCHPPVKEELRAWVPSNQMREPLSYFARNRNLVQECDLLLVVPYQNEHQTQGGTWYIHDYAIKQGRDLIVIWPDGSMTTNSDLGIDTKHIVPYSDTITKNDN